jgi:hypothetical protein
MSGYPAAPAPGNDADAWQILGPLIVQGGYLPWTSGSMRPAALVEICNEIVHGERTQVVECGAGVSTLLLARLLRERGAGSVSSLEHDEHWARLVAAQLRREGLSDIAEVIYAPLGTDLPWYQTSGPTQPADLLIVDGPPAFAPGEELRRAPALAHFEPQLVPGAVVFLDDLDRPGEQRVVADWEAGGDWRFVIDPLVGLARGERSASG